MKSKIIATFTFTLLLISFSGFCNLEPLTGNSFTEFGNYTVALSDDPLTFQGKDLVTYDLVYSNLDQVIKIGIDQGKKCKKFIVKSASFEVQYNCTKRGFGVKRMDDEYVTINPDIVSNVLDMDQFDHQAVILPEAKPESELLHLIACYFPVLMEKEIRQLVEK